MTVADRRPLVAPLLAIAIALGSPPARADAAGENATVAEALFRDGVTLFDSGRIAEACAKFGESYRLDPANGTLQNLALCHARQGRHASAWTEFALLAGRAAQAGQKSREQMARAQVADLEKKLARVALVFGADGNVAEIAIDGDTILRAAWSTPLPLDPGAHVLTFRAPGKRAATRSLSVPDAAATIRVDVPRLDDEPAAAIDSPAAPSSTPVEPAPPSSPPADASSPNRTIALVAGGAGVVLLGVGAYFGLRTLSQKSDGDAHCAGSLCDAQGLALEDDAHSSATWSTIGFAAGLGLVATGVVLWITAPSSDASSSSASSARVRLAPVASPSGGGLSLRF